jgi:hypothetical protein
MQCLLRTVPAFDGASGDDVHTGLSGDDFIFLGIGSMNGRDWARISRSNVRPLLRSISFFGRKELDLRTFPLDIGEVPRIGRHENTGAVAIDCNCRAMETGKRLKVF